MADSEPKSNNRLSWRQVYYVFIDWRIYLYLLIGLGSIGILRCLPVIGPPLLNSFTFSQPFVELAIILLYLVAIMSCLLGSCSAYFHDEHGFHISGFLSIAILGYILLAAMVDKNRIAGYVGFCLVVCGICGASPILLSWSTNNVRGHTKRAVAIGCFIAVYQLPGIFIPRVRKCTFFIDSYPSEIIKSIMQGSNRKSEMHRDKKMS